MAVAPEAEPLYAQAFAAWGIEPGKTSEVEAVRRIQELMEMAAEKKASLAAKKLVLAVEKKAT